MANLLHSWALDVQLEVLHSAAALHCHYEYCPLALWPLWLSACPRTRQVPKQLTQRESDELGVIRAKFRHRISTESIIVDVSQSGNRMPGPPEPRAQCPGPSASGHV